MSYLNIICFFLVLLLSTTSYITYFFFFYKYNTIQYSNCILYTLSLLESTYKNIRIALYTTFYYKINILIELFFYSCILFFIALAFLCICYNLALNSTYAEKASGYECGFDPFSDARDTFHINFYLIAILFILFDIELLYFFPWIFSIFVSGYKGFYTLLVLYFIFIACFLYE